MRILKLYYGKLWAVVKLSKMVITNVLNPVPLASSFHVEGQLVNSFYPGPICFIWIIVQD